MKKHTLLIMILLVFFVSVIKAQVSVTGIIVDKQTLEPIAGVTIIIKGTSTIATTNDYGKFKFLANSNSFIITLKRIGYIGKDVSLIEASKPLYILLSPSPVELTGVQVVGNNQILSSQSLGILTQRDLERSSGLSLENSINMLPGIFMQSRTPWGGARITIRGYYPSTSGNSPNSNGLGYQVFLNNIPITDATGSTVFDDIDFGSLGNVEIIKGPSSSLYGSFIGGTILSTTKRPAPNKTSIQQQTIGGSNGLFRSNTAIQSSEENSDIVVNYGHQTYNSFRPHSASRKDFLRLTGDFEAGSNQTISTYFGYNRSFEELAGEIDSDELYDRQPVSNAAYLANDSHIKIQSFRLGVTDFYRFNESLNNQTTVFGSGKISNQPFAHGFTNVNQLNYGVRTAFNFVSQGENIGINGTLGGMFQHSNLTSNGVFIIPIPSRPQRPSDQENYALNYYLFTEWNLALPMGFNVTAGASLNKNEFGIMNMLKNNQVNDTTQLVVNAFDPVVTPRIAVSKVFSEEASIYVSISTGYAPPLLSDAIASDGSIDTDLKPERAIQYELGSKGNLFNGKLAYQLALFDLENTDKLVRETSNSVTFTTNAGKQQNRGVELSLSYLLLNDPMQTISILRPWISYTYSNFKYSDFKSDNNNSPSTVDFSGNKVARVPDNMISAGVDLTTNCGLYFYGTYQYIGKVPVTFDNSTFLKSYNLLNAKIGFQREFAEHFMFDISAGGDNLTGSTYYAFVFTGPNIKGLTLEKDGGTGDGYIIPAPYKATFYGNLALSYAF
jgi:iron complex outermembrane recepter protein